MHSILITVLFFLAAGTVAAQPSQSGIEDGAREVPAFIFRCLDDPSQYISSASLAGTVYLVDFWATWCPPHKR